TASINRWSLTALLKPTTVHLQIHSIQSLLEQESVLVGKSTSSQESVDSHHQHNWSKMLKLIFLISLAVVSTAGMLYADSCTPDCTGKNDLDKVADPLNCTNYYICLSGIPSDHALPCDAGMIFNAEDGNCATGPDCTPSCEVTVCPITCNGTYSFISDPFDCSTYYICLPSDIPAVTCPSDRPYFNGETCVKDKGVCCQVSCTPYCGPGIVEAPDPFDCRKYYMCTEEGVPNEAFHFQCDSGESFDYQTGRCAPGATCKNLCD
ncbi:hypothetical protein OTU49_016265, partial [Cherax quadricarinatus]